MRWQKSKKFLTAFITSRYLPFIWLIHTGWQTHIRPEQPPGSNMATKRRPSMRTRMKVEDVSSWVEHNQQPSAFTAHDEANHVRFNVPKQFSEEDLESGSVESILAEPVYLNGGKGWWMTLVSFIMHAVLDGTSFCVGIMFVSITKFYRTDRARAGTATALLLSLPLCLAPLAGLTSDVFGIRFSILLGSSICIISTLLSIFATNIYVFIVTFGIGCGSGMSFCYNAAILLVTYYFEEHRSFATALAVSGTGVGTFVYPFYLGLVIMAINWFMIVGELQSQLIALLIGFIGVFLLGLFAVEDPKWTSDEQNFKLRKFNKQVRNLLDDQETETGNKEFALRHAISLPDLNITLADRGSAATANEKNKGKNEMPARSKSVAQFENQRPSMPVIPEYSMLNSAMSNLEHLDLELANSPCNTVKATRKRVVSKTSMSVDQVHEMLDDEKFCFVISTDSSSSDDSEKSNDGDSSSSEPSEKIDKNLVCASSVPNSARASGNQQATSSYCGGRVMAGNAKPGRFASNLLTMGKIPSAPMLFTHKKSKSIFQHARWQLFRRKVAEEVRRYPSILRYKPFRWLMASCFFLYLVLDVPYVYFYDYAVDDLKMAEHWAAAIYSSIGGTNLIFTIIYGKLGDLFEKIIANVYSASMIIVGLSMCLAIFATNEWKLLSCGVIFGSSVTANYVLQSVIVSACFEDAGDFQPAYSVLSFVEGIAALVGPVAIFAPLREYYGSYALVFTVGTVSSVLSGFAMYMYQRTHDEEQAKKLAEANERKKKQASKRRQRGSGTRQEVQELLLV